MSLKLPPQDWMSQPATKAVMTALGGQARFVGGCVRDALAGRRVKDVDLATPLKPEEVMALLKAAGLGAVPTGLKHGTVTAIADHKPFEITTLRRDVETDGRHAEVVFTDDWQADAARRDLTINALFADADGTVIDFFGGAADLAAGRVRFVGKARQRIEEDYLRLLRFFRFHAHYGQGAPDAEGLAAASDLAPQLSRISAERKRDEFLRLLAAPDPLPVLQVMRDVGVLKEVLPEALDFTLLGRLIQLAPASDSLLRLAALLPRRPGLASDIAAALRLANAERLRLDRLLAPPFALSLSDPPKTLRQACYRLGAEVTRDLLLLLAAEQGGAPSAALAIVAKWQPLTLPFKGRDLLQLGLAEAGPAVGKIMEELEAWWIDEDFQPDRSALIEKARAIAGRDPAI